MLPYGDVHRDLVSEHCTPLGNNPSNWWHHLVIGDFWIDIVNGQVLEAQYDQIMNDLIKNRPP